MGGGDYMGFTVNNLKMAIHIRVIRHRPHHGVADEVRKRNLPTTVPPQEVINDDSVICQ